MATYYEKDFMQGKKLSDLKDNEEFLTDALTFLRSKRKNYTEEDLQGMSGEDVVYDVLEHFRIQTTNEMTMAKDYYFIDDHQTPEQEKQAFGRLMYAFDNAEGEGLLDAGGAKIKDYAEGIVTSPSTIGAAALSVFTGGGSLAAQQAGRQATLMGLRGLAKKQLGRAALVGAMDATVAGGSAYGLERLKKRTGQEIGEDYDVNMANVGAAAVLGGTLSGVGSIIAQKSQGKKIGELAYTIQKGQSKNIKETAKAVEEAEKAIRRTMTKEQSKLFSFTTEKVLRSIDPALVKEGMDVKKFILSEDLPDGLIGGLDRGVVKRLGAAAFDLAERIGVKPEAGQRITERLALAIQDGDGEEIFSKVAEKYGLSNRQLSAAYAAEVSEAAKILATQSNLVSRGGAKVTKVDAKKFRDQLDDLYDRGMSSVSGREASELDAAQLEAMTGVTGRIWRNFKKIEDGRRAFMTSQPATTMRNNIFGGAMVGIDIVDQIFAAGIRAVKGDTAAAASTMKNSLKTFQYLTKDPYVAEALTTMLSKEAPEKMSRVFLTAAQAEATVVKETGLARLGNAVNVLNTMSDHVFKRAVITSTIDRELGKLGNERLGKSVMEMLEKGTISQLPDDILDKALNESFAFTFQRRFGGKDASKANQAAGKAIKFVHDYGLTVAMPFPRYIASQAKFISDYTGLTVARRGLTKATDEEYAKLMTGAVGFAGAYMIQKDNIEAGREWYEAEGYDGQIYNAQAALGPAAMDHYIANWVARWMNGDETKGMDAFIRDGIKIGLGTEFKPNAGLVGKMVQAQEAGDWTPILDEIGDYFGSFTYPLAVLKDFHGQFDARASYYPETRDPTNTSYYVEIPLTETGFNIRMATFQRMARQLPDFNLNEMSKTLKDATGIDLGETQIGGLLKHLGGATRTQYQTMYDPTKGDTGYDMIRFDIFGDGPLRVRDPMGKQLTGLVGQQPKNALQRELSRLQIDPFKLYNPYREKNSTLEVLTQARLQGRLAALADKFVISQPNYPEADNDWKKLTLTRFVKDQISLAREESTQILKNMQGKSTDWDTYIKGEVLAMSRSERQKAEMMWEMLREPLGYGGVSYSKAQDMIQSDPNLDEKQKQARSTTLAMQYLTGEDILEKQLRARK